MIRAAIGLFVLAAITAIFAYGGYSTEASNVARIFFYLFTVGGVIALIVGLSRRNAARP